MNPEIKSVFASKTIWGIVIVALVCLLPAAAIAQEAAAPASVRPDQYEAFVTPLVALGLTAIFKKWGNVQGIWLVLISGAVGVAYDALMHFTAGSTLNPVLGLLAGLSATALHQVKVQLTKPPV